MNHDSTDWVVVLIAALLNMAIGFFWYSKWLFGPTWLKLSETKWKAKEKGKFDLLWTFLVSVVIAFFLSFFARYLGVTTVLDGVFLGFCVWLGFVATKQIDSVIWAKRPFKLFAINTGCDLLSFIVMGGVVGA